MSHVQVLIVNAYSSSKYIQNQLALVELVRKELGKESHIIERKIDELDDYVLDWEHEILEESRRVIAKRFDKLEMIILAGDESLKPWDPQARQLVVLMHMCNFVKKPILACGAGAFHATYSLCTAGSQYDMINGVNGERLARLPTFKYYAKGDDQMPSGWLDYETGDVYQYDTERRCWRPAMNTGLNRKPKHGEVVSNELRPSIKQHGRDLRTLKEQEYVETLNGGEDVIQVRNIALGHYVLQGLKSPKFVLNVPSEWHLNTDGGLPPHDNLFVLADGTMGPIIATYDNSLLLACEIHKGKHFAEVKRFIRNYINHILSRLKNITAPNQVGIVQTDKKTNTTTHLQYEPTSERKLLLHLLFGKGGEAAEWTPVPAEFRNVAPALAVSLVPTTLSKGPKRVGIRKDTHKKKRTQMDTVLATTAGAQDGYDYEALTSPRTHTTLGKKPHTAKKRPTSNVVRRKRLDIFLENAGHPEMQKVNKKAAKLAERYGIEDLDVSLADEYPPLESARQLFGDANLKMPKFTGDSKEKIIADAKAMKLAGLPPKINFERPLTAEEGRWTRNNPSNSVSPTNNNNYNYNNNASGSAQQQKDAYGNQTRDAQSWLEFVQNNDAYDAEVIMNATRAREHNGISVDIKEAAANNYLPMIHPQVNTFRVPDEYIPGRVNHDKDTHPKKYNRAQENRVLSAPDSKPFNNHQKYETMKQVEAIEATKHKPFEGTYSQPYRSEHEQQIYEYNEAKKKYLTQDPSPKNDVFDFLFSVFGCIAFSKHRFSKLYFNKIVFKIQLKILF